MIGVAALSLSGCISPASIKALQSSSLADQQAAMDVANRVNDQDLQRCVEKFLAMAEVPCPVVTGSADPNAPGVLGAACSAAKAYVAEQAVVHSCAAVNANAKSAVGGILAGLGL